MEEAMHAVINHLPLKSGTDWTELGRKFDSFQSGIGHSDFLGAGLIRASDTEGIVFVLFKSREALVQISRDVAGPWFAENVRPHLAGPVSRSVGQVVGGGLVANR
jgi:hypothetical protein